MGLVDQLNIFRTAILTEPFADETYAQWQALEPHLSNTQQNHLLKAWNTYLKTPVNDSIVHAAFDSVIRQLERPIASAVSGTFSSSNEGINIHAPPFIL